MGLRPLTRDDVERRAATVLEQLFDEIEAELNLDYRAEPAQFRVKLSDLARDIADDFCEMLPIEPDGYHEELDALVEEVATNAVT